jgi:hypothetical protein
MHSPSLSLRIQKLIIPSACLEIDRRRRLPGLGTLAIPGLSHRDFLIIHDCAVSVIALFIPGFPVIILDVPAL